MITLSSLFAGLPATRPAALSQGTFSQIPLYAATLDEWPLSIAVLRESSPSESRFFMSENDSDFHELARASDGYPHETPGFHPVLTRTPGLVSMALIDDGHSLRLLRNDPSCPAKLQTVPFSRDRTLLLQRAALFVFPDGEAPALEGGLAAWWNKVTATPPSSEIPVSDLVHVVRMAAHKINNGMSCVATNLEMSGPTLALLESLFGMMADSDAVSRAMSAQIRRRPAMKNAIDELLQLLPRDSTTDEDPLQVIRSAISDLKQLNQDAVVSAQKTNSYVQEISARIPNEIPIGASEAKQVMRECEGVVEAPAAAPVATPAGPAPITAPLLLVDDNEHVREMLVSTLGRKGFANIVFAASLSQALDAAEKLPDLRVLLTDFNLSATETGVDLARRLKKRIPNLHVLLITGNPGELKEQLTAEEAAEFISLSKPFDVAVLAQRLRSLLEASVSR